MGAPFCSNKSSFLTYPQGSVCGWCRPENSKERMQKEREKHREQDLEFFAQPSSGFRLIQRWSLLQLIWNLVGMLLRYWDSYLTVRFSIGGLLLPISLLKSTALFYVRKSLKLSFWVCSSGYLLDEVVVMNLVHFWAFQIVSKCLKNSFLWEFPVPKLVD